MLVPAGSYIKKILILSVLSEWLHMFTDSNKETFYFLFGGSCNVNIYSVLFILIGSVLVVASCHNKENKMKVTVVRVHLKLLEFLNNDLYSSHLVLYSMEKAVWISDLSCIEVVKNIYQNVISHSYKSRSLSSKSL